MSIKIDVSISFTGLLQVVKKKFFHVADRFYHRIVSHMHICD